MKLLQAILKRISALLLAFALGVMVTMLWIYHLPDGQLGSNRYDLAKAKEDFRVWWYQPHAFKAFVPQKYEIPENVTCILPNPLTLVVSIDESKHLDLNGMDMGRLEDTSRLKEKFAELFRQRLENRAYKEGMESRTDLPESERIEKTVYVKAAHSLKYSEVLMLIDELKGAGANPIGIVVDNDSFFWLPAPSDSDVWYELD